ncbi:MAG: serine/threonine protein kinase [Bacteroidaceae bacterium]|nr:serine/threonine protein kinase [Bacteroidaceae bacterium]
MNIIRLQGNEEKQNSIYYEYDVDAKPLGEGGMGRVFKGFRVNEKNGERIPVAIKAIYDNIPERIVERARREAAIQVDNDNLIRMYGFIETVSYYEGGKKCKVYYHIIMELLVGVTLDDIINGITTDANGTQIPFAAELYTQYTQNRSAAIVRIMKPILSGLIALHDKGYIHRDIDPSNVMITEDGKIKLIDFGICKKIVSLDTVDKALTATGVFMGKVNYAAPELVLGDVSSQSYTTDIYALGILLYQLSTGHLPFSGTDQDILSANLRRSLPMKDVRNSKLKRVIRKATEKIQSKRYASVTEMLVDLEKINTNKLEIDSRKIFIFVGIFAIVTALSSGLLFFLKNDSEEKSDKKDKVTCKQLYDKALLLLNEQENSLKLQGKELLSVLAEDSLYLPAKMKYYVLLLNSRNPEEVQEGYRNLEKIALKDASNSLAQFECGLTLSAGNSYFSIPTIRQSLLNINVDLDRANRWLYKSMNADISDYKAVYWAYNNLMEKKRLGTISSNEMTEMERLYSIFEERVAMYEDPVADLYRKAIKD